MGLLVILLLLLVSLFMLIGVGAASSDKAVKKQLEEGGTLCLGKVRDYDSDDIVTVDFVPGGALVFIDRTGAWTFFEETISARFPNGYRVQPTLPGGKFSRSGTDRRSTVSSNNMNEVS